MSGVVKSVKKAFRKNKLFRAAVIGAAVWFTVGTASAYFAAPEVGIGEAMSASLDSMWTTITTGTYQSGAEALTASAPAEGASAMLAEQTAAFGAEGAAATNEALASAAGAESAGVDTMAGLVNKETTSGIVNNVATNKAADSGALAWMNKNPAATMVLGQGLAGAYQGYVEDKQQRREEQRLRERGLGGYSYEGTYGGPRYGGIVASRTQPKTVDQAINAPSVEAPSARQIAVKRQELPQLKGRIA